MKIIENEIREYVQEPGIDGMYKAVRDAAAICYQTDTEKMKLNPKDFVEQVLLKNGHTRPLEFGTVYLKMNIKDSFLKYTLCDFNDFQRGDDYYYITTNLRVIAQGDYETDEDAFENGYDKNWFEDLKYWCEPTEKHFTRRTFNIICSRGAGDDFRTHITLSSMMESTRYCNYSKGKFGNELTFIRPYWIPQETVNEYFKFRNDDERIAGGPDVEFLYSLQNEEYEYMHHAQREGIQAQRLKRLYPLAGKCELRLCGFNNAWQNFFWRRCDEHADPECQKVAGMIRDLY